MSNNFLPVSYTEVVHLKRRHNWTGVHRYFVGFDKSILYDQQIMRLRQSEQNYSEYDMSQIVIDKGPLRYVIT